MRTAGRSQLATGRTVFYRYRCRGANADNVLPGLRTVLGRARARVYPPHRRVSQSGGVRDKTVTNEIFRTYGYIIVKTRFVPDFTSAGAQCYLSVIVIVAVRAARRARETKR